MTIENTGNATRTGSVAGGANFSHDGTNAASRLSVALTGAGSQGNAAPVTVNDTVATGIGAPITIDVLASDTDSDGNTLLLSGLATPPANGQAAFAGSGITSTPNAGFPGQDSFQYLVFDGTATAIGTVIVQVGGVANERDAVPETFTLEQNY